MIIARCSFQLMEAAGEVILEFFPAATTSTRSDSGCRRTSPRRSSLTKDGYLLWLYICRPSLLYCCVVIFFKVRYCVKVTVDRPWAFNSSSKKYFTVVSLVDLNTMPHVAVSSTSNVSVHFSNGSITIQYNFRSLPRCSSRKSSTPCS